MTEPTTELYTYPDGSAVVGCPPFPKLSPLERAEGEPEPKADTTHTITAYDLQGKTHQKGKAMSELDRIKGS